MVYLLGKSKQSSSGVAFIVLREWKDAVYKYRSINDSFLQVRLNTKLVKLNIIKVYAPTSAAENEEIEELYNQLASCCDLLPLKEITIV